MDTTDPVVNTTDRTNLADLTTTDERIRLLTARLDALPESAEVEQLEAELDRSRRRDLDQRRIAHDMTGTLNRLRADAARLRARRRDDIAGLRADTDRERRRDLRHDLEVAERRLAELEEDIAREERTLATFGHTARTTEADGARPHGDLDTELHRARDRELEVSEAVRRELVDLRERSGQLRAALPPAVRQRYEDGEREHGMGAAALVGSTCRCCCIALDNSTARRVAATPPDRLLSCPECGVLLIRAEG